MYITTRSGARVLTEEAKAWLVEAGFEALRQRKKQKWEKPDKGVQLYADLYFFFPNRRRRDSHNSMKILLDALEKILYDDDQYVLPRVQEVLLDRDNPRLELEIYKK
jgi:crossover junction endodeoxyribonuclease RusA